MGSAVPTCLGLVDGASGVWVSVGCAVFLVGAFVRVGRLRSRRGLSAIRGFVELMVASVRGANSLVGLTWGGNAWNSSQGAWGCQT